MNDYINGYEGIKNKLPEINMTDLEKQKATEGCTMIGHKEEGSIGKAQMQERGAQ